MCKYMDAFPFEGNAYHPCDIVFGCAELTKRILLLTEMQANLKDLHFLARLNLVLIE